MLKSKSTFVNEEQPEKDNNACYLETTGHKRFRGGYGQSEPCWYSFMYIVRSS
mgnify:CR=1 FL=1